MYTNGVDWRISFNGMIQNWFRLDIGDLSYVLNTYKKSGIRVDVLLEEWFMYI